MLKKIFLITIIITLNIFASEFLEYERAFRVSTSFIGLIERGNGIALGLSYEQRAGNSIFEFNLTPKIYIDVYKDYLMYDDVPDKIFTDMSIAIETAIFFNNRPSIKTKEGPGSLTFNFWRYGIFFDCNLYESTERYSFETNSKVKEVTDKPYIDKNFGTTYNPSLGIQIRDNINIGLNFMVGWSWEVPWFDYPSIKYGGGMSLTISNAGKN